MITLGKVITSVKNHLKDETVGTQTITDAMYLDFAKDALRLVLSRVPRARLKTDGTNFAMAGVDTATSATELDWLDDQFFPALREYVLYAAYGRESGDKRDRELADKHLAACLGLLGPAR